MANALIHQNFDIQGMTLSIEIFGNRLTITNPGVPLIDTNRFIDMPPKSRNEKVAQSMFMFNLTVLPDETYRDVRGLAHDLQSPFGGHFSADFSHFHYGF